MRHQHESPVGEGAVFFEGELFGPNIRTGSTNLAKVVGTTHALARTAPTHCHALMRGSIIYRCDGVDVIQQ